MLAYINDTTSTIMNKLFGKAAATKKDGLSYLRPTYIPSTEIDALILKEIAAFNELSANLNGVINAGAIEVLNAGAWLKGYTPLLFVFLPVAAIGYFYLETKDYAHVLQRFNEQLKKLYQIYTICSKDFSAETAKNPVMQKLLEEIYPVVEYHHLSYTWNKDSIKTAQLPEQFFKILKLSPHRIDTDIKGDGIPENSYYAMGQQLAASLYLKMFGLSAKNAEEIINNEYGAGSKEAETILASFNKHKPVTASINPMNDYVSKVVKDSVDYVKGIAFSK